MNLGKYLWWNGDDRPSMYQDISHAFYTYIINDWIKTSGANYILPMNPITLIHKPGQPTTLCDENYLLVREAQEYTPKEESKTLTGEQSEGCKAMRAELAALKNHCFLWNFDAKNLIVIQNGDKWFVQFLEYQKPGLGGGDDAFFFQKNVAQNHLITSRDGDGEFQQLFGLSDQEMEPLRFKERP